MRESEKSAGQKTAEAGIKDLVLTGGPFVTVAERTRIPVLFLNAGPADPTIVYANDSFLSLTGYTRAEVLGESYKFLTGVDTGTAGIENLEAAFAGSFIGYPDVMLYRKDGSEFWVSVLVGPVLQADGTSSLYFVSMIDVTRKKQDERLQFLLDELHHRVKNTLASVQTLIAQTLSGGDVPREVCRTLEGRVLALARAHDLVVRESTAGVRLDELIDQILGPFRAGRHAERVTAAGPRILLTPKATMALAMLFHELVANAAKYGALSDAIGKIAIVWRIEQGPKDTLLRLSWKESGGPPVTLPARKGFGSRLIERGLAQELEGEIRLDYPREGVVCEIVMPLPPRREAAEATP